MEETGASSSSSSSSSSVSRDEQEARGKREGESTVEKHRRWFGGARAGELPREAARRKSDPPAADVFRPASLAPSPRSEAKEEEEGEEEEERKERDMASSAESADQFDGDLLAPPPARASIALVAARRASAVDNKNAASSAEEEKAIDDEDGEESSDDNGGDGTSSVAGSVGDASSQWEMLSERSGSAIVVSFSGSYCGSSSCYRSPSPSVLKNKFVLAESNGEAYMNHVVLPTDTLQGLCLAYKISATRLRMENNFSGNSLHMAPKRLRIPNANAAVVGTAYEKGYEKGATMVRTQDRTSREFKLYALVAEMPCMELVEAKAYLDLSNWDLDEAIRSAREDEGWSLKGGFEPLGGGASSATAALGNGDGATTMKMDAVAKPKALTARDIYACPPPFDGHGFELKDIRR
jgi:hypothetical protein